jgi:hypothetical protein
MKQQSKTHVQMSLKSSKINDIHVDQLRNKVNFCMGCMIDHCPR